MSVKPAIIAFLFFCACEPERATTGIIHDPGERARDLAAIRAEAERRRVAEAAAAERAEAERLAAEHAAEEAAAERRRIDEAERERLARAARCEAEKAAHDAALAGLNGELAKAKDAYDRRQRAEKWIASHCHTLAHKDTAVELYTDAGGRVHRRQVVTGTSDPFQACPAKTPEDIAQEGGLTYDDDDGWTRYSIPPMPSKPEDFLARRIAEIGAMGSPDCD